MKTNFFLRFWNSTQKYNPHLVRTTRALAYCGSSLRREQARLSSQWNDPLWVPIVTLSLLKFCTEMGSFVLFLQCIDYHNF